MLERKTYRELQEWKKLNGESAVRIEGARRVGKSWISEEFAKREYKSYLLIDFSEVSLEVTRAFEEYGTDFDSLFQFLQAYFDVLLHRRESLVVFDEVQCF